MRTASIEPLATPDTEGDPAMGGGSILDAVDSDYDAGAITVLEGLDPVRKGQACTSSSTGQPRITPFGVRNCRQQRR